MRNSLQISISKPCSEKFNSFNKTAKGGFCKACNKEVIDFRNLPDSAIIHHFKNNQQKTCGFFKEQQLKTYRHSQEKTSSRKHYFLAAAFFSAFALLSNQTILAQESTINNKKETIHKTNNMSTLSGVIYNKTDNTTLPGVSVVLKNSIVGTDTDFKGEFKLPNIKEGDVISFYSLGFISQDITIKKNQPPLKIYMEEDSLLLGDVVVVGAVDTKSTFKTKRSLWQRVKSIF